MILRNAADEGGLGTPLCIFASAVGVSRFTLLRWMDRQERGEDLADRPPRPGPSCRATKDGDRRNVIQTYLASNRTYGGRSLEEITKIPHATCDRIIADYRVKHEPVMKEPKARVEILAPLILLSADDVKLYDWLGVRYRAMAFQDEMSRYKLRLLFDRSIRSRKIQRTLDDIITSVGAPLLFKSDWGPEFKSREVQDLLDTYWIQWFPGPPYYPPFNGKDERANGEIKTYVQNDPAWPCVIGNDLRALVVKALVHLNSEKPRGVLGGRTSAQVFKPQEQPRIDRKEFFEEVLDYGRKLKEVYPKLHGGVHPYRRWAITCALIRRGLAKIDGEKVSTFLEPVLLQKS